MAEFWHWLLVAGSLVGVVLNIKHDKRCFWIWAITNATWAVVDFQAGIYSQAFLQAVYFLLAIWGLIEWNRCSN